VTDRDQDRTVRRSPFWRFSLQFYAVPGVAQACIELQDRAKVDVNVLFFLLWNATQKRALGDAEVAEIDRAIGAWREMTVVPLREVRRALKTPPPVMAAAAAESFRTRIKQVELEAERLQQEALYDLAQTGRTGRPVATAAGAAGLSVAAYQALLGPFPAAPLNAVLSAFEAFASRPQDGA
jgi:uncharacterized protein (TIGR02444 family)